MKKIAILLFIWLLAADTGWAQVSFQERTYRLNATGKVITASTLTKQGEVMLSGPVSGVGRWDNNVFMLIQPNLDTIWSRIGPKLFYVDQSINPTADNGFIFGGNFRGTVSPVINSPCILLQKLSPTGLLVWSNNYTSNLGGVRSIYELPDKDFFMGGGFSGNGFPFIRTDSLGNMRWQKDYSWSQMDNLVMMRPAQNGNFIAAGVTQYPIPTGHLKLMLVDTNGDSLKATQLVVSNPNRHEGMRTSDNSILSLSDGGFLVSASLDTTINNQSGALGMLVKVNSNLQLVWKYVYRTTPVWRQFSKMRELPDGSIIALAYDAPSNSQPSQQPILFVSF